MLQLKNITKTYVTGDFHQTALNNINLSFRESEFVAILGQSGSGKTTMLNIIGGLDRYDSGDLIINGTSTKKYRDRDWDSYRNHSIGFVFQSYNLIPHQSILSNVELALTLSGVSKSERRKRAADVLEKVGLGDQLHKKPNQMSGGQMQRVAIARALINNPDILLADEPTGALDSETSVQIMDLLAEIAKDRLIVMVTHNPELAEKYAGRIIHLKDGSIIDDSDPFEPDEVPQTAENVSKAKKTKKTSMSLFTAMSLSLNNLMTKKTRTFLTSFAGSIGIIGIALILSLSSGMQAYITRTETDTLSNYPLSIEKQSMDYTSMMTAQSKKDVDNDGVKAYTQPYLFDQIKSINSASKTNDMKAFKAYIEEHKDEISGYTSDIRYSYGTELYVYNYSNPAAPVKANPNTLTKDMNLNEYLSDHLDSTASMYANAADSDMFTEIFEDQTLRDNYYELLDGKMPESYNEVVLLLDKDNQISDYSLYTLGILDREQLKKDLSSDSEVEPEYEDYEYSDLIGMKFRVMAATDLYEKNGSAYDDKTEDSDYIRQKLEDALEINIVGVAKYTEDASSVQISAMGGMVGYLPSLTEYVMNRVNDSEIVKAQQSDESTDVFTGYKFKTEDDIQNEIANFDMATVPPEYQAIFAGLSGSQLTSAIKSYVTMTSPTTTYSDNLDKLGVANLDEPSKIQIYCKDFESKESITDFIDNYNKGISEDSRISYTDYIGLMMKSITTIINAISYILIAFVTISLVVSSIMIGIITYISVLERTKEIGILRSIGASKKDISRVFNAETLLIGFVSGALGIGITLLLTIPINALINHLASIAGVAALPVAGGIILVIISMLLTLIAGLIPARIAARKDPVEALRSE